MIALNVAWSSSIRDVKDGFEMPTETWTRVLEYLEQIERKVDNLWADLGLLSIRALPVQPFDPHVPEVSETVRLTRSRGGWTASSDGSSLATNRPAVALEGLPGL